MAEKEKKGISGEAIGIGLLALAWALGKKPPPGESKAGCSIQILDAITGQPVPKNSPALVIEGASYLLRCIVTNQSTKLGVAVSANFDVTMTGKVANVVFQPFPLFYDNQLFAASQALSFDVQFTIPAGKGGLTGEIVCLVQDPNGVGISSATEPLSIQSAAIVYKATCTLQVF